MNYSLQYLFKLQKMPGLFFFFFSTDGLLVISLSIYLLTHSLTCLHVYIWSHVFAAKMDGKASYSFFLYPKASCPLVICLVVHLPSCGGLLLASWSAQSIDVEMNIIIQWSGDKCIEHSQMPLKAFWLIGWAWMCSHHCFPGIDLHDV